MQDWRFDDLTRSLGKATSRRQVLKGLLGGLAATLVGRSLHASDAAAAGCDVKKCKDAALRELFFYENTTCNNLCHDRKLWLACLGCKINANRQYQKWLEDCEKGDGCLTVNNSICCGGICVDSTSDPQNCGGCGHVCPPGQDCIHGQCQCGEHGTICDGQCVDTQIDSHHCGNCDTVCDTCKTCVNGTCVDVDCGAGKVCCKDQCVDACSEGQLDPTTCQCQACAGKADGTTCGTNEVCCQEQCVSNQCSSPKQFDLDTCSCQCPPVDCPNGELQDPENCKCVDLCANKDCGGCATCDPTSGDCIPKADQTPCGSGLVCCNGTCQSTCDCPEEQQCITDPANSDDYVCCHDGEECGANSDESGLSHCCASANYCEGYCCDDNQTCLSGGFCCDSDKVTSDNGCCQANYSVCGAACCEDAYETCIGGSCCNNTQISDGGECCQFLVCNGQCCGQYQICGSISGEPEHCIDATPV